MNKQLSKASEWRKKNPEKYTEFNRKYYELHKDKILAYHRMRQKEYYKKHREEKADYDKSYYRKHKDECLVRMEKWQKENPEKRRKHFKKAFEKWQATHRQELGWELLYPNPFDESEEVDSHHQDDIHVVYLPKDLHRLGGEYSGVNVENHRINLSYIVAQIYGGDMHADRSSW
jgi:hypothetical protein